jgi:PAS domain S-box-containing protein
MIRKRKQNQLKRDKFMGCVLNNPTKLKNGETERKRSEEELKQLKHQYELILQSAGEGIVCLDLEGNVTFANPFAVKTTGYKIDELIGQNLHELLHYKKPDGTLYPYEECPSYETLKTGIFRNIVDEVFFRKDGTSFPVRYTSTPIIEENEIKGAVVTFRDITERKRIEEKLQAERKRLNDVLEILPVMICLLTPDYHVPFANRRFRKHFGESHGRHCYDYIFHRTKPCPECQSFKVFETHTNHHWELSTPDGNYYDIYNFPFTDSDGSPLVLEMDIDITERKQAEKEIVRLASFPLTSPSPVLEVDSSGTVTFYNSAAIETLKRLGVKENLRLFFPRDIKEILKALEQKKDEQLYREIIIGDATFEEYIQIVPQYNCIRIRSIDISERKKLESQLLQSQKMETVGQLSGGIAHDFNNILTAIIGYASILQMKMSKEDPLRHNADQILASSERAANLTRSLLTFSRKQIMNIQPVKINEIVKRVENLLLRIIGADIYIKTILTEEDLTIMADPGQIEQVLMNLATNARDAMPNGGSLTIETEIVELDEKYIKTHGYGEPGIYVRISFTDTGEGMDKETKEKIFEPFFTTKEVGKGTGLGLSMVYGIVKQHNGYINVYSELGKGTTFKIYLPLIKAEIKETKLTELAPSIEGTEMILLAEDDEDVRTFTKAVLDEFGYTVIEAVDGQDAINKFMQNKDKIHLLLLDAIMPKKSGKDAYEKIKKLRPDTKALFMSGYSKDVLAKEGILEEGLNFVLKPVSPTNLLRKVREALDK